MIQVTQSSIDELKAAGQAALAAQLENAWNRYATTVLQAKPDGELTNPLWRDASTVNLFDRGWGTGPRFGIEPGVLHGHPHSQFATNCVMLASGESDVGPGVARSAGSLMQVTTEGTTTTMEPVCGVRYGVLEAELLAVLADVRAYWAGAH